MLGTNRGPIPRDPITIFLIQKNVFCVVENNTNTFANQAKAIAFAAHYKLFL
jgi:hypothetical protein